MRQQRTKPMRRLLPLLALLTLAACARGTAPARCAPTTARLENLSGQAIEQLYLGPVGTPWGSDLVTADAAGGGELPSRAGLPLRFTGRGPYALRVVWVNGQAAELSGIDGCLTRRLTVLDGALRAE